MSVAPSTSAQHCFTRTSFAVNGGGHGIDRTGLGVALQKARAEYVEALRYGQARSSSFLATGFGLDTAQDDQDRPVQYLLEVSTIRIGTLR